MQQIFHQYVFCIATVKSLQFSRLIQNILLNYYYWNAFVNPKRKFTCENCCTQTTRNNIVRHKKSCSAGTLYCTQYPNFSTKSQNDPTYHIAKKHNAPKLDVTFKCKLCYPEFRGFFDFPQHRNTQHEMQIGSRTRNVDVEDIVGDDEDHSLTDELRSCQLLLVDSELERTRHKVFNYAMETLDETIVNEKLDLFFNNLKCAAKINVAFGFILKVIEDGGSDTFTHTKTIPCWIDPNLCAPRTTLQSWKLFSTRLTS